jgi:alkylhydroperoxidase family enzyme
MSGPRQLVIYVTAGTAHPTRALRAQRATRRKEGVSSEDMVEAGLKWQRSAWLCGFTHCG